MRKLLLILVLTVMYKASSAQFENQPKLPVQKPDTGKPTIIRICAPSRSSILAGQPLVLVYSHDKIYVSDTSLSRLPPKAIKSINVLRDTSLIKTYGNAARNGTMQVYINDKEFPDAYKLFENKTPKTKP